MLVEDAEEDFCDMVASYTQFPDVYINKIYDMIQTVKPGNQINILKEYSRNNHHAICGVVERIKKLDPDFDLKYGGSDTNLRKEFRLFENILHESDSVRQYLQSYRRLSPLFIDLVLAQVDDLSSRIIGEIFSLENYSDMESLKDELRQVKSLEVAAGR